MKLQPESTLEVLLTVPALDPAVEDSLTIAGLFLTHRQLRQTFQVNEARAIPAHPRMSFFPPSSPSRQM